MTAGQLCRMKTECATQHFKLPIVPSALLLTDPEGMKGTAPNLSSWAMQRSCPSPDINVPYTWFSGSAFLCAPLVVCSASCCGSSLSMRPGAERSRATSTLLKKRKPAQHTIAELQWSEARGMCCNTATAVPHVCCQQNTKRCFTGQCPPVHADAAGTARLAFLCCTTTSSTCNASSGSSTCASCTAPAVIRIRPRNNKLVTRVPAPRPPSDLSADNRSPMEAPRGLVSTYAHQKDSTAGARAKRYSK